MPTTREFGDTVRLKRFDLIGTYGRPPFVRHASLAAAAGPFPRSAVPVDHMGPPIGGGTVACDVRGATPLTDDERTLVELFVARNNDEHESHGVGPRHGYCVLPHAEPAFDRDDTLIYHRFSCAGFVVEAYRAAGIDLLDTGDLPGVSLAAIADAYPELTPVLDSEPVRRRYGLAGPGPWPVVLSGYLFHALNRPDAEVRGGPYVPAERDRDFS